MAHPLALCPTGMDCVACPHPGAFWAPGRLWTGVLEVKGVLEARSEQRDALSRCSQEWQAPSPSCPSSPLILQAPAQTSAPAEATFSAQSGQSSCLLRCPSQTLHLMFSPGRACERLTGGAVFPEPRTITGPAGRGGPGAVRLPSGVGVDGTQCQALAGALGWTLRIQCPGLGPKPERAGVAA